MYAIELDWGGDWEGDVRDDVPRFVAENGIGHDVTWEVVNEHGPAAGAPIVRFTCPSRIGVEGVVRAYAPLTDDGIDGYDQAYLLTTIDELPG